MAAGKIKRLMVDFPPQHGKSTLISGIFPAWFLATFPDSRLLLASYGNHFAQWWGQQARDLFKEWGPVMYGRELSTTMHSASWWGVQGYRGYMATAGAGGTMIGRPADGVIIDDPVSGPDAARSSLQRQALYEWYLTVLRTRLSPRPHGFVIIVMSRWHADDLSGRLLKEMEMGGDQWDILHLPALAEDNDALGREPGEALWPERYDEAWLAQTRAAQGEYRWAALYQGSPRSIGGTLFHYDGLRTFQLLSEEGRAENLVPWAPQDGDHHWDAYELTLAGGEKEIVRDRNAPRFMTVDPAIAQNTTNDYTAIGVWAELPGHRLALLHIDRARREGEDIVAVIMELGKQWGAAWAGIEDVQAQRWLIQMLHKRGFPAKSLRPRGDKVARAQPAIISWNNGDIFVRRNASWANEFIEEVVSFDKGAHDDQVDILAYAADHVAKRGVALPPAPVGVGARRSPWQ